MRESVTYQAILEEGRQEGARHFLLRIGQKRFGPPSPSIMAAIEAIDDAERLEALGEQVFDVTSWEELLAP